MNKALPKFSKTDVAAILPLRPVQQGMLFHDLSAAGVSPYFRQVRFSLDGEVDPALCEAAWNAVMARHSLLRSVFDHETASQPVQIVLTRRTVEFLFRPLDDGDSDRIEAWMRGDRERGFDLRRDSLMRIALFRLGPSRYDMVWSHPHILLDGWSGAIVLEDFALAYAALRSGLPPDLPAVPDPASHDAALASRDDGAALAYWTGLLEGYDELASLPRPGRQGAEARPSRHEFLLDETDLRALNALAVARGTTLGTVFQALWGLVLCGWTDRRDVVFGTVVSGRSVAVAGIERLVGMFINTIPVRVRFDARRTFLDLLEDVGRQAVASLAYDHVGLAAIQAATALPHGILDHVVVMENYPATAGDGGETGFRVIASDSLEQANYDFGVMAQPCADGIRVTLPYDGAMFSETRMARIEAHLRRAVAWVTADPLCPLGEFDMIGADEKARLASFAQGPSAPWPHGETLADLWHRQVDAGPGRVALVAAGESVSYEVLDRMANAVAHRLRGDGLTAGEIVGVLAARGPDRIAALLGILKAGCVYLPLSPALPDHRLSFLLADTGCRRVLTDGAGTARLIRVAADVARPIAAAGREERCRPRISAEAPAYVIHTSGSTGEPKGVVVGHAGFINMITAQIAGFGIRDDDAVVQFASCSFDASLSEIFMALLAGARLVLADEDDIRDGARLVAMMRTERVTVATLPPSYLRALERADLAPLRVLITAGEPPDAADASHYGARLRYFNAYGPTEASVCACWHEVAAAGEDGGDIPIGRPIANTVMTLLDRSGREVPLGAEGEICLSGVGLAHGYLGRADLTAERFETIAGRRIYRTGDRGRWREDGAMLYLGRRDGQVKLHGYRIEPGEIESRLRAHAAVAQAAVVLREDPRRLVAYVVASSPITPEALRADLARVLPPWMVPAAIVLMDALPHTLAGKIDRRALPVETSGARPMDAPPQGDAEWVVAEAFAQVLGHGPHGRHASFSALGGDSLRAIRLLARLRRAGFALDLRALLEADTVSLIAASLEDAARGEAETCVGDWPLTPIQRWFLDGHRRGHAHLNHQILLRADHRLAPSAIDAAVAAVWRHHDALRATFHRGEGGWRQRVGAAEPPPGVEVVDLGDIADPWMAVRERTRAHHGGFDLEQGPLFKAVLYRLADGDYLSLLAHHLVTDAVSWRFLLEDLLTGLASAAVGRPIRLPAKSASYGAWAHGLLAWSRGPEMAAERAYWQVVADAEILPFPTDAPRVEHGYGAAETALIQADLGPVAPGWSDTALVARLLAALGRALAVWDGRDRARVTLSSHGRDAPLPGLDASRTVGWFTADFPFLLSCRDVTPAGVETALAAVPSKGMGWGAARWLADQPLAAPVEEISLNYLGETSPELEDGFHLSDRLALSSIGAMERCRLLELEAGTAGGRLWLALRYASGIHRQATMERLLGWLVEAFHRFDQPTTGEVAKKG